MKLLIWIMCLFGSAVVNSLIKAADIPYTLAELLTTNHNTDTLALSTGIITGILTAATWGFAYFLAVRLCKRWDKNSITKRAKKAGLNTHHANQIAEINTEPHNEDIPPNIESKCPCIYPQNSKKVFPSKCDRAITIKRISILLAIVSIISIILALNLQDVKRNSMEVHNPTLIYFLLLGLHCTFLTTIVFAKNKRDTQPLFALLLAISTTAALCEGTIFSKGYSNQYGIYQHYAYNETVLFFNGTYVIASFNILAVHLPQIFHNIRSQWYANPLYHDRCYKRLKKMRDYLNDGVITQEEFEKSRTVILRHITSSLREDAK